MTRTIGGREFDFERQVAVMAVVNRTPDSFYDKGSTFALDRAVAASVRAAEQGADWVDIGGVPFGRGPAVSLQEEIDRVVPVVAGIHERSDVVVSVDTTRAEVARLSIAEGASVVNDTSGLHDPDMLAVVASSEAQLVITHSLGAPRSEPVRPEYDDVVASVIAHLRERRDRAVAGGVPDERIILDPGHDLNKNTLHTLELTRRLGEIAALGLPVLAAVSNKDFIGETLDRAQGERLEGSLAAAVICILNGARIVRMHDVRQAVDAVRLTEAVLGWRAPAHLRHNIEEEPVA
ncbi:dihydropteroate synthase [Rathayibacter caricis DSM 15933]|uniref:Dihydropteroate synthase n=1 Tax=Rathayibacter caricis DSM 15933 TaxID=1328867 RepID=A0A2T4UWX0_9MICO|nr:MULTISPECIES: dihydropteroate synthase [Rathayibacter]KQQ19615.1 dihydropteroate synthase [Rathayibacter sp. Leaf299]PTL74037.1 dihydropteroate synthase [Rathayibacter caricis DSM 15933]